METVPIALPRTEYAADARLKIDMVNDQLAGKEMSVGRFYLNRDQHLAAINRFRNVVENENFQTTSHTPEALHRIEAVMMAALKSVKPDARIAAAAH